MKFRVISDLHIDINHNKDMTLYEIQQKCFTLVCGDISGDPITDVHWLECDTNMHGAFIAGNHIVYNTRRKSIQDLQNELRTIYPNTLDNSSRWKYLEKDYIVFEDEKIVIFGATLWTDFNVGHPDRYFNMSVAKSYMNDYRFGIYKTEDGATLPMCPEFCAQEFDNTIKALEDVCNKFKDYTIIVMTHHCPSMQSISSYYRNHKCNGAYVSNLEDFILSHPNIKAWCCGHVHSPHTYSVGQCQVIANPHGYNPYGEDADWKQDEYVFEIIDGNVKFTDD